uniref:Uncharacterized protein n=1 Tax=Parastrongyloides trichosuri TaxID=131310 RepID=A0A0N4Z7A1_PARTI
MLNDIFLAKVNGIVFQRLKDKVNEDQLKEVSTKVVELSEIFEKLLQDSGYEKPVFVKRHAPYRRRFNNKKVKTPSGKNEQESSKNDSNEENINYSIPKKVTKKGNHSKSYKKFNNKHGKIGDKEVEEKSGENQKETNNSKKTKGKRPIKSKLTQSNA